MPPATAPSPIFSTTSPGLVNLGNKLLLSLPILNIGPGSASNVIIQSITFGSAGLVEPSLPLPLGQLGIDGVLTVGATFTIAGLTVGNRYLTTVRGTYESGGVTYGFTVNRYVVLTAVAAPAVPFLEARAQVTVNPDEGVWAYTFFNNEPAASPRFIGAVSIDMAVPFVVDPAPTGWIVETDNSTYVLWYTVDISRQIAPGASLGQFRIHCARRTSEARALTITPWNQNTNQSDVALLGTTLTPSRT